MHESSKNFIDVWEQIIKSSLHNSSNYVYMLTGYTYFMNQIYNG